MVKVDISETKEGIFYIITSPHSLEFTTKQIEYHEQTLLAIEVYQACGDFNTEYLLLKDNLQTDCIEHLGEQYLTLIKDPDDEILISIEKGFGNKRQIFISSLYPHPEGQKSSITKPFGEGFLGFINNAGYYLFRQKTTTSRF